MQLSDNPNTPKQNIENESTPEVQNQKHSKSVWKWLWLILLALLLGLAVTLVVLSGRLKPYAPDEDENMIPLIPSHTEGFSVSDYADSGEKPSAGEEFGGATAGNAGSGDTTGSDTIGNANGNTNDSGSPGNAGNDKSGTTGSPGNTTGGAKWVARPGFEASDGQGSWETETNVSIFKASYANANGDITVESFNGDKLIAPGTENAYTFRLKNTGNVAMDYVLDMAVLISEHVNAMPIEVRMKDYEGNYLLGSETEWVNALEVGGCTDEATLGVSRYALYTLEWRWPFETGYHDHYDTYLGNLSNSKAIIMTVNLKTIATPSDDPNAGGGIATPKTGDDSALFLWGLLAGGAFLLVLILLRNRKRDHGEEVENEEDKPENGEKI